MRSVILASPRLRFRHTPVCMAISSWYQEEVLWDRQLWAGLCSYQLGSYSGSRRNPVTFFLWEEYICETRHAATHSLNHTHLLIQPPKTPTQCIVHIPSTRPPKVGIRNLSPHLRNSAILRTTKSIAELRPKKSCETTIADLQNLTSATFCSLLPVPLLSGPFSSAQNGFKNKPKIF